MIIVVQGQRPPSSINGLFAKIRLSETSSSHTIQSTTMLTYGSHAGNSMASCSRSAAVAQGSCQASLSIRDS